MARNVRELRAWELPGGDLLVGGADRRRLHPEQDLARTGLGCGHIVPYHQAIRLGEDDGPHGATLARAPWPPRCSAKPPLPTRLDEDFEGAVDAFGEGLQGFAVLLEREGVGDQRLNA